ncbi:MAG: RagB/SusD family nutrient uptake outer membrane protein [Bacteroides sp.]|nr:RagB/SusD family nutrient uptake outer membrane protein [Bacteroides sp.]
MWIPEGARYKYTGDIGDKRYTGQRLTYEEMFAVQDDAWLGKWFDTRKYGLDDNDIADLQRSGANERILRYADVLLMYAECCLETDDPTTALQYINKVRERANNRLINRSEADAHLFYAQTPRSLPTAEEVITASPTLGRVVDGNGTIVYPGVEINSVRRILKHEYTVELFMEG